MLINYIDKVSCQWIDDTAKPLNTVILDAGEYLGWHVVRTENFTIMAVKCNAKIAGN